MCDTNVSREKREGTAKLLRTIALLSSFSFYQVWIFAFFFEGRIYQSAASTDMVLTVARIGSLAVLAGVLGTSATIASIRRFLTKPASLFVGFLLLESCLPAAMASSLDSSFGIVSLIATIALSGTGTAVLGMLWAHVFSRCALKELFAGILANALAVPLLFVACHILRPFTLAVLLIGPGLSFLAGFALVHGTTPNKSSQPALTPKNRKPIALFCLCWTVIGIAFGVLVTLTNKSGQETNSFPWIVVFSLITTVAFTIALLRPKEGGEQCDQGSSLPSSCSLQHSPFQARFHISLLHFSSKSLQKRWQR